MWYIDDHKKLVVCLEDVEERFIILNMKRLANKEIDDDKDNYWAFNTKQIILREKLFDWDAGGLNQAFREKRAEVLKDAKKQQGKTSMIVMIAHIALLKNFEKKIARRQKAVDDKIRIDTFFNLFLSGKKSVFEKKKKKRVKKKASPKKEKKKG